MEGGKAQLLDRALSTRLARSANPCPHLPRISLPITLQAGGEGARTARVLHPNHQPAKRRRRQEDAMRGRSGVQARHASMHRKPTRASPPSKTICFLGYGGGRLLDEACPHHFNHLRLHTTACDTPHWYLRTCSRMRKGVSSCRRTIAVGGGSEHPQALAQPANCWTAAG